MVVLRLWALKVDRGLPFTHEADAAKNLSSLVSRRHGRGCLASSKFFRPTMANVLPTAEHPILELQEVAHVVCFLIRSH